MKPKVGESYYIQVKLQDGKVYQSRPSVIPEPFPVENIGFKVSVEEVVGGADIIIEKPVIDVLLDLSLESEGQQPYLRWNTTEVWNFIDNICFPLDMATECFYPVVKRAVSMPIFHSEDPNQKNLTGYSVFKRDLTPTIEFNFRHYFNISQFTISEDAYRYWEQVNLVSQPTGSIFDVQPGLVEGNLYNVEDSTELVMGYFEVAGVTVVRTFTLPQFIEEFDIIQECIPFLPRPSDPPWCCFCFLLEGGIPRPEYWGE